MTDRSLLDRLLAHRTLGTAPREELEWLADHGSLISVKAGDVLSRRDTTVEALYIVLSGSIAISVDGGAGPQKFMEWRGGDVTGLLPYSRMVSPPGDSVAQEDTTVLAVPREHLRALTRECHDVTARMVHVMVDRARTFTSSGLQAEKMVSLGKLAAGLAHELNNPASAIERAAGRLESQLQEAESATRTPGAAWLTESQLAAMETLHASCRSTTVSGVRSPIEQAERVEAITDWLADHGLEAAVAEGLAETPVTVEALDRFAAVVDGPARNAILRWMSADCSLRSLAVEIQDAAMRISGLVHAIKGFTHMDQARVAGPVDVMTGLNNTVAVLKSKARSRSIGIDVDAEAGLPRVLGFAGELNQVWANLIDNALDAVEDGGQVEIRAGREGSRVVVRIIDDGRGIPENALPRIFDPFFTTKPVGQGTGLGLDIVRRLVSHNSGEIGVESGPGRTEFRVLLPVAEAGDQR